MTSNPPSAPGQGHKRRVAYMWRRPRWDAPGGAYVGALAGVPYGMATGGVLALGSGDSGGAAFPVTVGALVGLASGAAVGAWMGAANEARQRWVRAVIGGTLAAGAWGLLVWGCLYLLTYANAAPGVNAWLYMLPTGMGILGVYAGAGLVGGLYLAGVFWLIDRNSRRSGSV